MSTPLLEVSDLRIHFGPESAPTRAVDAVSFSLEAGQTLALVGESGCGKSLTALSIPGLVPSPPARILDGSSVRFRGEPLLGASPERLRGIRGAQIGMVFQEPMTSLNPVLRVGGQVAEALTTHGLASRAAAAACVLDLLERVGLPDPQRAARAYPHELSGGMRQRVMIAIAVACGPALLIADEPTTALDVTVQAQILDLLASLQEENGMSLLLISHDLAVVSSVADRVAVMYAGQIVEEAPAARLFARPVHPYTEGLLRAVPNVDGPIERLAIIPGRVPHPARLPSACRFHPRCPYAWSTCREQAPRAWPVAPDGTARCWLTQEPARRAATAFDSAGDGS